MCVGTWYGGVVGNIQVSGQCRCPGQALPSGQGIWMGTVLMVSHRWSNDILSWEMVMGAGRYERRRRMAVPGASLAGNGLR